MSGDRVTIEVNGVTLEARNGQMLIEVTDAADIYVPRFCYHEKLSVAANCRMCLVDIDKTPKPLPACATPVADGMKVYTKSKRALSAQKSVMEFLLINHPLDCPICDQGGECELQDLAMGFGRDVSRFTERKRVVTDKNIGPLVSTDMTRCIHCTRCVRFGQEIAGIQELGTTGRTEDMQITTYVERSVDHELSGNIIDLCPVGALNNKPFRYRARGWEMLQHPLVSPHDCVGSNLYVHTLRGRVMRVVPRPNEAVNETWIADRDRFSCHGNYEERLEQPLIRREGEWRAVDWREALGAVTAGLQQAIDAGGGESIGALISASATLEEHYLLARLMRGLGSSNIDHRLRQLDFRGQTDDPPFPWLGLPIAEVPRLEALLVVGSNLRREAPMLAHRVRQAALARARVMFLNPERYEYLFPVADYLTAAPAEWPTALAALVRAAAERAGREAPEAVRARVHAAGIQATHRAIVEQLMGSSQAAVWLGQLALRHPAYAELQGLAAALAELTGARLGYVPEGANAAGAAIAGALPHRAAGGRPVERPGRHARQMLTAALRAYLLWGIEPRRDCADGGGAATALAEAEFVVAMTAFASPELCEIADVLLPIATVFETPGTFINVEGRWQSFEAASQPHAEARSGWKVLRVLGNLAGLGGFDYEQIAEVYQELHAVAGDLRADNAFRASAVLNGAGDGRLIDVPMYAIDALVRRSRPLQQTRDGRVEPAGD